MISEGSCETED